MRRTAGNGPACAGAERRGVHRDTAVVPAYRSRGLAKRLKAAFPRGLSTHRPGVRLVTAATEVTNAPLLAVDRAASLVPVATRTQTRLDLG
jgi:hypothetical protein